NLTATSTYTFVLAPNGPPYTGSATVHIYDVPADQTGPIVSGVPVPVQLSVGQNARLTFTGAANDRVCASTTIPGIASGSMTLLAPWGLPMGPKNFPPPVPAFLDTTVLPSSGTYTLVIDPLSTNAGNTTAWFYTGVPQDYTGTLTLNNPSVPVTLGNCQNG